jgi:bloom syndrome protein
MAVRIIEELGEDLGFNLKEKQLEAVLSFLNGKDVFVSLPTGYGKSIIYAILPLVFDKYKGMTYIHVCRLN